MFFSPTFMHHLRSLIYISVVLSLKGCPKPNRQQRKLMFLTWSFLFWCIFLFAVNAPEAVISNHPFVFSTSRVEKQTLVSYFNGVKSIELKLASVLCSNCMRGLYLMINLLFLVYKSHTKKFKALLWSWMFRWSLFYFLIKESMCFSLFIRLENFSPRNKMKSKGSKFSCMYLKLTCILKWSWHIKCWDFHPGKHF